MMRCADKMRVQSRTMVGSLEWVAITRLMVLRPGGRPALPDDLGLSTRQRVNAHVDSYLRYLNSMSNGQEAAWAAKEIEQGRATETIASEAAAKSVSPYGKPI